MDNASLKLPHQQRMVRNTVKPEERIVRNTVKPEAVFQEISYIDLVGSLVSTLHSAKHTC